MLYGPRRFLSKTGHEHACQIDRRNCRPERLARLCMDSQGRRTVRHKGIDIGVPGVPQKVEIELTGSSAFPVQVEHKNTGVQIR